MPAALRKGGVANFQFLDSPPKPNQVTTKPAPHEEMKPDSRVIGPEPPFCTTWTAAKARSDPQVEIAWDCPIVLMKPKRRSTERYLEIILNGASPGLQKINQNANKNEKGEFAVLSHPGV
mmetsp:Transcript_71836/g.150073  ORF Transcript_71836/g.150073 Transcript_71836/m.150073 type:complete len:120 (+) Transcript_71836:533-892(+)